MKGHHVLLLTALLGKASGLLGQDVALPRIAQGEGWVATHA